MIADDHAYINARMAEIKAERIQAPVEYEVPEPKEAQAIPYLGWDIYAPVNPTCG